MSDIFISYASENRATAQALAGIFLRQGWSVWWDRKIPAGKSFEEVIEQALTEARCVIVLWSKASIASDWVRSEAQEGVRRRILVPVLIEKIEMEKIPLSSRRLHAADLTDWSPGANDEELSELIDSVRSVLSPLAPDTDLSYIAPAGAGNGAAETKPNDAGSRHSAKTVHFRNAETPDANARPFSAGTKAAVNSTFRIRWNAKFAFLLIALVLSVLVFLFRQYRDTNVDLPATSSSGNSTESIGADAEKSVTPIGLKQTPVIEIIDPPLISKPGTIPTVHLHSIIKEREIIGKIDSPPGIMSVTVNDTETALTRGIFRAKVDIRDENTPVTIVTVDKNGVRASLEFILALDPADSAPEEPSPSLPPLMNALQSTSPEDQESIKPPPRTVSAAWKNIDFGDYHALVIGINHYRKLPPLKTAVNDAKAVDDILSRKYGFKTTLLIDANRYQILSALNELRAKLTEIDNLLIYYAGHSELDGVNQRGQWLPEDAAADNTANWISTASITDILNSMAPRHVLVVADSAYSGKIINRTPSDFQAADLTQEKQTQWLKTMLKSRSRSVLTSGGTKPVLDAGGGDHSLFAAAFIKALRDNNGVLAGQELYRTVSAQVIAASERLGVEQTPEYGSVRFAGHESGEFFFLPR